MYLCTFHVPQGNVLGPLLFTVFINDLPQCIHFATPYIFADNTKNASFQLLPNCKMIINSISSWSHTSNLLFNKSKFVLKKANNQHFHITINSKSIRSGSSSKLIHTKPISSAHQHFYFTRIVRLWNHMPILSLPTNLIKRHLTTFLWNKFINTFNPTSYAPIT